MSKQKTYKLNDYIKGVEELARRYKVIVRISEGKKGSAVSFKMFIRATDEVPDRVWGVYTGHTKKREIWSKEDYKKPPDNIGGTYEEFLGILESL